MPATFTTDLPDEDQPVLGNGVEDEVAVDRESAVSNYGDVRVQIRETGESSWDSNAVGFAEQVLAYDTLVTEFLNREDGEEYEVRARTETEHVTGTWTATVSIVTLFPGADGLSAVLDGTSAVDLSWTDNSDNEDGFRVLRETQNDDGTWSTQSEIANLSANTTSYSDTSVTSGDAYRYQIEAYTDDASALSNTDTATVGNYLAWSFGSDDVEIRNVQEELRTFTSLELVFRVERSRIGKIRTLSQNNGKVNLVKRVDGGFDTVDTASGNNTFVFSSPLERESLRTIDTWRVSEYVEKPFGSTAGQFEVELILIPDKEKAWDNEYGTIDSRISDTADSGEFLFEFERGDVATDRVSVDVEREGRGTIDEIEFSLVVTETEARIIEESVSKMYAIDEREINDGPDVTFDTSSDGRNTFSLTSANEDVIASGNYAVKEWETEWLSGLYRVALVVEPEGSS